MENIKRENPLRITKKGFLKFLIKIGILVCICHIWHNLKTKVDHPFLISKNWMIALIVLCLVLSIFRIARVVEKYKRDLLILKQKRKLLIARIPTDIIYLSVYLVSAIMLILYLTKVIEPRVIEKTMQVFTWVYTATWAPVFYLSIFLLAILLAIFLIIFARIFPNLLIRFLLFCQNRMNGMEIDNNIPVVGNRLATAGGEIHEDFQTITMTFHCLVKEEDKSKTFETKTLYQVKDMCIDGLFQALENEKGEDVKGVFNEFLKNYKTKNNLLNLNNNEVKNHLKKWILNTPTVNQEVNEEVSQTIEVVDQFQELLEQSLI